LSEEQQRQQQDELEQRLPEFDVVITTALIPGRTAPRLIPASAVAAMRPGSVIVDLAAETGGNCELTEPGEEVVREHVSIVGLTIRVLAIFLGFEVISKVPTLLHTPLMSGTNAIHGIVIVGAMLVMGAGDKDTLTWIIGFVAVILASANVVGGFVVTDRMLEMFKRRETPPAKQDAPEQE